MKIISMFVFCLIGIVLLACGSQDQNQATAPVIPVYQVQTYDIPIYQEFVGQVYGYKDIAIRARVEGFLEGIYFQEGSHVKQGAKLYSIERILVSEPSISRWEKPLPSEAPPIAPI